jgi:hypothetical protein
VRPPKRQTAPDQGAAADNTITNRTQSSKRERLFHASEGRRLAVATVAVDKAIKCAQGRCKCDCQRQLEEIIKRHSGPGEAA